VQHKRKSIFPGLGDFTALRPALSLLWSAADGTARRALFCALLAVITTALITALIPFLLRSIIDKVGPARASRPLFLALPALIAAYSFGQFSSRVLSELRTLASGISEQRVRRLIGARVFSHLMTLPLAFHLNRRTGSIGEIAEQGLAGIARIIGNGMYVILPLTIELATIWIVLLELGHALYFVILSVGSITCAFAVIHCAWTGQQFAERAVAAHLDGHAVLTDSLLNYETIKYFCAEAEQSARYQAALAARESSWVQLFRRRLKYSILIAATFATSVGVTMTCAAYETLRNTLSVGGFVLIVSYALRSIQPLESLGVAMRDTAEALASVRHLLDLVRQPREASGGGSRTTPIHAGSRDPASLAFEGVRFRYSPFRHVLSDVTFHVPAGGSIAIVGSSGAGKSSIVRLLYGLVQPDSGRILLDGEPIATLASEEVRRSIAVVPQDTVLFNDTIGRNIALGRPGCTREDVERAARLAHLDESISLLPHGYETLVGERGLKLSGGERQRVAIARAVLKEPRIIVFDEATSSLDTATEREILRNLAELSRCTTTVIIAHRLSTVIHADEIVVLDAGCIGERGSHAQLLQKRGLYAALWRAQQDNGNAGRTSAATARCLP
jgi:ABC-type transport system involved in Fe-S cluster assembly fused permease/ATPase subunit